MEWQLLHAGESCSCIAHWKKSSCSSPSHCFCMWLACIISIFPIQLLARINDTKARVGKKWTLPFPPESENKSPTAAQPTAHYLNLSCCQCEVTDNKTTPPAPPPSPSYFIKNTPCLHSFLNLFFFHLTPGLWHLLCRPCCWDISAVADDEVSLRGLCSLSSLASISALWPAHCLSSPSTCTSAWLFIFLLPLSP